MSITLTRANGNYLTVPYNAVLAPSGAITLAAWVKPSSAQMQRVLSRYSSTTPANEVWGLDVYQNNARLILGKGTTTVTVDTVAGGSVPAGVWSHIAGTWNGSTMIVYVNGVQVNTFSRTTAITTSSTPMSIGADYQGAALVAGATSAEFFDGSMADLRVYKRALSANEVMSMYTSAGSTECLAGIVAHFHFQGSAGAAIASGTTFKDRGPTGLVATLVNGGAYDNEISRRRRSL